MKQVHIVMQAHRPFKLKRYGMFEIGVHSHYFDHNEQELVQFATKMLDPVNKQLQKALNTHNNQFKFSLSISGTILEHLERFAPDVLASFSELLNSDNVELLAQPYHNSLAYVHSQSAFAEQIRAHRQATQRLFNKQARVLRNTALLYDDKLPGIAHKLGLHGVIAPQSQTLLGGKHPGFLFRPASSTPVRVIVEHTELSQSIQEALHTDAQLAAERILSELAVSQALTVNMRYDTIDPKTVDMYQLATNILSRGIRFVTASDIVANEQATWVIGSKHPVSKFDTALGAQWWEQNDLQKRAAQGLWDLYDRVVATNDEIIINDWSRLSGSDHFGFMTMKKGVALENTGEHVSRHDTPYEVFIAFMNACEDLAQRTDQAAVLVAPTVR